MYEICIGESRIVVNCIIIFKICLYVKNIKTIMFEFIIIIMMHFIYVILSFDCNPVMTAVETSSYT